MSIPFTNKEIEGGKLFAAISYIGFLCIVALIFKKNNNFALFHAKHGLVLFVFESACLILSIMPLVGWFIRLFGIPIFIIISLWGVIQSLTGNDIRIPVISKIAAKIVI